MDASSRHLVFHGLVVLLYSMLLGFPLVRAMQRTEATAVINAWRVAHLSLSVGATLMLAVAAALPLLRVAEPLKWVAVIGLIVSSYAFCASKTLGAMRGQRGLSPGTGGTERVIYLGNLLGVGASLLATLVLLVCAWIAL